MPVRMSMSSGTRTITSQEPWKKLLDPTTRATTAVVAAPAPLTTSPKCQPSSRRCHQRTSIPAWDSVKARKTPRV